MSSQIQCDGIGSKIKPSGLWDVEKVVARLSLSQSDIFCRRLGGFPVNDDKIRPRVLVPSDSTPIPCVEILEADHQDCYQKNPPRPGSPREHDKDIKAATLPRVD